MNIAPIYLLYGVIALCAVLLIEGVYLLVVDRGSGQRSKNRRMQLMSSGLDVEAVYNKLRRADSASWQKLGILGEGLSNLNRLISRTGLTISTGRVIILMALASFITFVVLLALVLRMSAVELNGFSILIAAGLSAAIGFGVPILYFMKMKSKRMKSFGEQLPDAIDMMVRSLRAGHPVGVAIGLTAKEMPDPIGTEFGIAIDEMTYGLDLPEALTNIGNRIDVPDFDYLVVAISIQHETGGNLAEILNGLSVVIRARFQMFRKISALAAEGRFSAKLLSALPLVFVGLLMVSKPDYYSNVADDPLFLPILFGAAVTHLTGIFVMHKLINFRV